MKIFVTSVMVDDQAKALEFYTQKLGFVKKTDVPAGEYRWLTVEYPESPGFELLLEPMGFAPAREYQNQLFNAGIPLTMFSVGNIQAEYDRLNAACVKFTMPPTQAGPAKIAVLEDTCGNLIQIAELPAG